MTVESIEEALALDGLGLLVAEDLPAVGLLFLESGADSAAFAALAGAIPAQSPGELRDLFREGLRSCGRSIPDRASAAHVLKRIYARRGCTGADAARVASREIISLYHTVRDVFPQGSSRLAGEPFGIHSLLGVYYSYDDVNPNDLEVIRDLDRELVLACFEIAHEEGA